MPVPVLTGLLQMSGTRSFIAGSDWHDHDATTHQMQEH
jgi:hypothetical protein